MLLLNGDCIEEMQKLIDDGKQVDSIVTDPPYHLTSITERFGKEGSAPAQHGTDGAFARASKGFMGKEWDGGDIAFRKETWELAYKLLKPGGHLLAFSGSRTYHRMAVAIEDAGFDIRDQIMWLYGSGFPKSLNIGKAIDKKLGNDREVVGTIERGSVEKAIEKGVGYTADPANQNNKAIFGYGTETVTKGNTEWEGWGTALKPAHEPIVMARKPISEKSIADNVLKHGTGGINIDGCRVEYADENDRSGCPKTGSKGKAKHPDTNPDFRDAGKQSKEKIGIDKLSYGQTENIKRKSVNRQPRKDDKVWTNKNSGMKSLQYTIEYSDSGDASRYFYCPKVSRTERDKGLSGKKEKNSHPTVKPVELMKYLCRMVTPKGGTVLDIFMGSGSTGMAAKDEGFDFIGIEKDKEYFQIAEQRIKVTAPLSEFME